ncbi:MAG: hypothetical protein FWF25_00350 [Propionibacteriaceae bacterium]|nr:hypothetical protein [Propionibacteriaceae bacterium]
MNVATAADKGAAALLIDQGIVSPEAELASRVLQGLSAVFVLLMASRNPPIQEIDAALTRVGEWAGELSHTVASSPQGRSQRELIHVSTDLNRALGALQDLLYPGAPGHASDRVCAAGGLLQSAAAHMDQMRGISAIRTELASCGCAAHTQNLSQTRNNL